jgi:hypothetical protein
MASFKNINSKSVIKQDFEYLESLHNAVCKAIIDHNRNSIEPNVPLLNKQASIERMMKRHKNILECGFHDKELTKYIPANGIGNVSLV